jgi:hypothetical protein
MAAVGFQHILHNLELYGFGSEEAGIVQTVLRLADARRRSSGVLTKADAPCVQVKELAENAFDACKGQGKETYIRVGLLCALFLWKCEL